MIDVETKRQVFEFTPSASAYLELIAAETGQTKNRVVADSLRFLEWLIHQQKNGWTPELIRSRRFLFWTRHVVLNFSVLDNKISIRKKIYWTT